MSLRRRPGRSIDAGVPQGAPGPDWLRGGDRVRNKRSIARSFPRGRAAVAAGACAVLVALAMWTLGKRAGFNRQETISSSTRW